MIWGQLHILEVVIWLRGQIMVKLWLRGQFLFFIHHIMIFEVELLSGGHILGFIWSFIGMSSDKYKISF